MVSDLDYFKFLETLETFEGDKKPDGSIVNLNAMRILWTVTHSAKAKRILEIGVEYAYSSLCFAYAMKSMHGKGELVSVEINPEHPAMWKQELVRSLGVEWEIVHDDSLFAKVPPGPYDILFIDGEKWRTSSDFDRFAKLVSVGGYIMVDDWPCFEGVVEGRKQIENTYGIKFVPLGCSDSDENCRLLYRVERPLTLEGWPDA